MIDWTATTDDPLDPTMRGKIQGYLRSISTVNARSLADIFSLEAVGRSVLHIGCCEHSKKYIDHSGWKHRRIAESAKRLVGLDINYPGVETMRQMGYDVICADATSDQDLGERFDRVVIGDVIEHVDNQIALLQFAERHLSTEGQIMVSTPNPFFIGHVTKAWFSKPTVANFEHVVWVTESNALELARRSGLTLLSVCYPIGNSSRDFLISSAKRASYHICGTALFTTAIYTFARSG